MSKILFNIDDLALILVISSSLIFAKILLVDHKGKQHKYWLSAFLLCIALSSLNSILYWSPIIRVELAHYQPHIFLALQTALFAAAPVLYLYAKSLIQENFTFSRMDALYLTPPVIYLLALPAIYFTLGKLPMLDSALNYQSLYTNPLFWVFTWVQHLVKIGYGATTLHLLQQHKVQLQHTSSNTDDVDGNWLKIMVVGFLLLWVMQAFSQLCHELNWTILAQFVALSGNYFLFALVNFLVILSLTRSTETTKNDKTPSQSTQTKEYTSEQVKRLERTITERQPHLKPDLTLEELSKISSIPQRTLSSIINRHHKKNFFEYVNEHRAERAALLLLEQNGNLTMLDIMEDAGFNSKSAFNRFFKKSKGMTPTQYKNQQQKMGQ